MAEDSIGDAAEAVSEAADRETAEAAAGIKITAATISKVDEVPVAVAEVMEVVCILYLP